MAGRRSCEEIPPKGVTKWSSSRCYTSAKHLSKKALRKPNLKAQTIFRMYFQVDLIYFLQCEGL